MKRKLLPAVLALTTLSAACFQSDSDDGNLADVLPDDRLQVNMPLASDLAKSESGKDWASFYLFTAEVTEDVNWVIGSVLYWVNTITTSYQPSYVDREQHEAEWGPWSLGALDPVESLLWVSYAPADDTYEWGLDRWPQELSREDASTVVAGHVDAGATPEASSGAFDIDFTRINELDPTEQTVGLFSAEYEIRSDGVAASAGFQDFGWEGFNAVYDYEQTYGGDGSMDLVLEADMDPLQGSGLQEVLNMRSRWTQDGSGRSDVLVTGGDLGSATAYASECWSSSFERVYYYDTLTGLEEGSESACVFEQADYSE